MRTKEQSFVHKPTAMAMQPIAFKLPAKASIFTGLGLVGIVVLIFVFRSPPQEENGAENDQPLVS